MFYYYPCITNGSNGFRLELQPCSPHDIIPCQIVSIVSCTTRNITGVIHTYDIKLYCKLNIFFSFHFPNCFLVVDTLSVERNVQARSP